MRDAVQRAQGETATEHPSAGRTGAAPRAMGCPGLTGGASLKHKGGMNEVRPAAGNACCGIIISISG